MLVYHSKKNARRRARIRGHLALELLLLMPVLLAILFALVEMAALLSAGQKLHAASAEGARVASRGASPEQVEKVVRHILGQGRFAKAEIRYNPNDENKNPLKTGDPVEVRVEIQASNIFPNLLAFFGVGLDDRKLVAQSIRIKE